MKRVLVMPVCVLIIAVLCLPVAGTGPAQHVQASQTTIVVLRQGPDYSGTSDAFIDSDYPNNNYGWSDWLMVAANNVRSGLIRFELRGYVPDRTPIRSAVLELYAYERAKPLEQVVATYRVRRPWSENQATWNLAATGRAWGAPGCNDTSTDRDPLPSDQVTVSATSQWVRLNVTAMVQDWVNNPAANYGLMVRGVFLGPPAEYMFLTRDSGHTYWRPTLRIEYGEGGGPTPSYTQSPTQTRTMTPTATGSRTPSPTQTRTATRTQPATSSRLHLPVVQLGRREPVCDAYEPNNSYTEAYGPLVVGSSYVAYLCSDDPADWYYVDVPGPRNIVVNLAVPAVADYDLYLYYEGDWVNFVGKSNSYGFGVGERIVYSAPWGGRYYVLVHPFGARSSTHPYVLSVSY
ncbi:MAG TPA: DNRLRE domain-containing protein [Anaerolineae bacterium]|nr:DNRLRE domain-containing protein [Anaerolineae bacterium]